MNILPPYLSSISVERQKRIKARFSHDKNAEALWLRALDTIPEEREKLIKAYDYAVSIDYRHEGLSSDIYIAHPVRVAALSLLSQNNPSADLGVVSLLHNVFEVSDKSFEEIEQKFGSTTAEQIAILTVDRSKQWDQTYKKQYYQAISTGALTMRLVKIFDKLDNLFILGINPNEDIRGRYLKEIEEYIMPMVRSSIPALESYYEALIADTKKTGFYEAKMETL